MAEDTAEETKLVVDTMLSFLGGQLTVFSKFVGDGF
jgi:hypothetical protein